MKEDSASKSPRLMLGVARKMAVDADILDPAFAEIVAFSPEIALSKGQRLLRHFPKIAAGDEEEVLKQVRRVTDTVWSLAERGGEAKMKKQDIIAELMRAHPFLHHSGLKQALFLVNYYAWHEGYDK